MGTPPLSEIKLLPPGHVAPKGLKMWLELMQKRKKAIKKIIITALQGSPMGIQKNHPSSQTPAWGNLRWEEIPPGGEAPWDRSG